MMDDARDFFNILRARKGGIIVAGMVLLEWCYIVRIEYIVDGCSLVV